MLKPLIRTLNGWRFELPLALVLGAAVAFALIALPWSPFGALPVIVAHVMRLLYAALAGLIAGFIAYRAMKYPWPVRAAATVVTQEEQPEAPPIDVSLRLRRSDAHPDFPPREPIRASRDLGEPFMDIVGFDTDVDAFAGGQSERMVHDALADPAPAPREEPVAASEPEPVEDEPPVAEARISDTDRPAIAIPEWPLPRALPVAAEIADPLPPAAQSPLTLVEEAEEHDSIAAFTPEPTLEPTPLPERARRESLAEMMERLSAGLERRAGKPVAPPPADMLAEVLARPRAATPELRDALDELNRLAGRRG